MKFEDRVGTNLNKKILEVESVERDQAGEITLLEVKEFRNDGEGLIQEGTPLNAEKMNDIVSAMASSVFKDILKKVVGITYDEKKVSLLPNGDHSGVESIYIETEEPVECIIKNEYTDLVSISANYLPNQNKVFIELTGLFDEGVDGIHLFNVEVEFISKQTSRLIHKEFITIQYISSSTTPQD